MIDKNKRIAFIPAGLAAISGDKSPDIGWVTLDTKKEILSHVGSFNHPKS